MHDTEFIEQTAYVFELKKHTKALIIILISAILLSFILIVVIKLREDDSKEEQQLDTTTKSTIVFNANNIPTLRYGHYTLWAINTNGTYHFIKRFNSVENQLVSLNGEPLSEWAIEDFPEASTHFIITIEPEADRNEEPTDLIFMQGEIINKKSQLDFNLIDLDTPELSAQYILATPSDGNQTINEQSGVWFANPETGQSTLKVPVLTGNWAWEARLYQDKTNFEIGKFSDPSNSDDFSRYSLGQGDVFRTPGEDFLTNLPEPYVGPINLTGGNYHIVISIEPYLNNIDFTGELVFVKIFESEIPLGAPTRTTLELEPVLTLPELTLEIQ